MPTPCTLLLLSCKCHVSVSCLCVAVMSVCCNTFICLCLCLCARLRACVRECVRAWMLVGARACVRACVDAHSRNVNAFTNVNAPRHDRERERDMHAHRQSTYIVSRRALPRGHLSLSVLVSLLPCLSLSLSPCHVLVSPFPVLASSTPLTWAAAKEKPQVVLAPPCTPCTPHSPSP